MAGPAPDPDAGAASGSQPRRGLVLFGPPAAGKDTVTAALTATDPAYEHFQPLKAGPGRTRGYRMTSPDRIDQARRDGQVVWTTHRYDAQYVIDAPGVAALLERGRIPVLHLADPAALVELEARFPHVTWQVVVLTCPRDVAARRIQARATGDTAARLAAYDVFREPARVDHRVDTAALSPEQAAAAITAHTTPAQPPGAPR